MQAEPDATQMVNSRPAVQAGSRPAAPKMEIRGVSKTFHARGGEVAALEPNATSRSSKGEFVTVVGPSGCGKSTLMMIAAGLEATEQRRDPGRWHSRPAPPGRAARVVFQRFALFPSETAAQNIAFGLRVAGLERAETRTPRRRAARADGPDALSRRLPARAVGRHAAARRDRARARVRPEILLMDEPFGALDAQTRTVLQEEVSRLQRELHYTVLFITHSVEEAVYLSDRVVVMSRRPGPHQARDRGAARRRVARLEIEEAGNHASIHATQARDLGADTRRDRASLTYTGRSGLKEYIMQDRTKDAGALPWSDRGAPRVGHDP